MGAAEQTLDVLGEAENRRALRRFVGANSFEDSGAVMQGVGQHVYLCLIPIDQFAVHPNLWGGDQCGHCGLRSKVLLERLVGNELGLALNSGRNRIGDLDCVAGNWVGTSCTNAIGSLTFTQEVEH